MSRTTQATRRVDRRTKRARAEPGDPRERLLDAAAAVFSRRGYRAASVDEIAREAGFSKGAVYWHFASKEDLFFALLDERIDQPVRELLASTAAGPPGSAPETGRRVAELMSQQEDALLLQFEYWAQAVRDPKLRRRFAERTEAARAAIATMLDERSRHLGSPEFEMSSADAALGFFALAQGLAQLRLIDPKLVPEGLYGHFLGVVYDGLLARAKGLV